MKGLKKEIIIKNAVKCNICGDIIESKYRHDFVICKCGAVAVDGGHEYLRRVGKIIECTDMSIVEYEDLEE